MPHKILPIEKAHFEYFAQHSELIAQACVVLKEMMSATGDFEIFASRIKDLEHEADNVNHRFTDTLHQTFCEPDDRYTLHKLMNQMDNIMDFIDGSAARIILYDIDKIRPEAIALAEVIEEACKEVDGALDNLQHGKNIEAALGRCIEIQNCEFEADKIQRAAISKLFREEKNPIDIIKWKEIFEMLEGTTDRCEDVANIIEILVIEATS
jgi:uncharacterized protein